MTTLLTIEGLDGSGKQTLTENLTGLVLGAGKKVASLAFPQYERTRAAKGIARYLNGEYGALHEVSPWFSSMLFAFDRAESLPRIEELVADNEVVLLDRYVASNLVYHAAKLPERDQPKMIQTLIDLEFEVMGLPRPHLQILIRGTAAQSHALLAKNEDRTYTDATLDLNERDAVYLDACAAVYDRLVADAVIAPWEVVELTQPDGGIRPPSEIAADAFERLERRKLL